MKRFASSIVAACLLSFCSVTAAQDKSAERWGTNFKESCYSPALDADISFAVRMPPKQAELEKYPLVVVIKNGLKVAPSAEHPFIEVKPPSGGIWGYRTMSAVHARTVIEHMKKLYPIDEDRVYLVGFSAGASGAMQLASTHADQYAAVLPLVAVGTDYPIANFRNLPVAQHHGTVDWTSAICNARGQHQRMKALGCPAELTEYPGVGHSVPPPHEPIVEWMLKQKRERSPEVVTLDCETPASSTAYWLRIEGFEDPHRRAKVYASLNDQTIEVSLENVRSLSIEFDSLPGDGMERLKLDDQEVDVAGLSRWVAFSREESTLIWRRTKSEAISPKFRSTLRDLFRPYQAGAAANLYDGTPLLVVYGTASGSEEHTKRLRDVAKRLAACGGPHPGLMAKSFGVVADRDLTAEQLRSFNLIVVGRPGENVVTDRFLPQMPLKIEDEILKVEGREGLALQNRVLSFFCRNPENRSRLIYLVAPFVEGDAEWKKFAESPQRFLIGSDGFDRISQADLAVKNLDHQFCRQMQFGRGWRWLNPEGEDRKIPARFGDRSELAREYMKLMREKSGADYALWWGPADRGMWGHDLNFLPRYDPNEYTLADFRTQHREIQTLTGSVTRSEWHEILKRWGDNEEMIVEPAIDRSVIDDKKFYRLHVPMDFYIKLGQRKKALVDPRPGPRINIEELEKSIFAE